MKRERPFYHVTAVPDVQSIMRSGLKGGLKPRNRVGEPLKKRSIFVLTTEKEEVTDFIAISRIWPNQDIEEYAVIEIDVTVCAAKVMDDTDAELSAGLQRIIEQDVIEPKHLKLAKVRKLAFPGRRILDIHQALALRKWTADEWDIARQYLDAPLLQFQEQFEKGKVKRGK